MERRPTRVLAVAACALVGCLTLAPAAWSLDKGVHIDPGSPAGQEYAFPLAAARQQASGEQSDRTSPDDKGPLFGVGISRRAGAPAPSRGAGKPSTRRRGSAPVIDAKDPERVSDAQLVRATTESRSVPAWIFLLAAAVVAVGLAAGVGLRRVFGR